MGRNGRRHPGGTPSGGPELSISLKSASAPPTPRPTAPRAPGASRKNSILQWLAACASRSMDRRHSPGAAWHEGVCTDVTRGERPDTVDPARQMVKIGKARTASAPRLSSRPFEFERDFLFHAESVLPRHCNGLRFTTRRHSAETGGHTVSFRTGCSALRARSASTCNRTTRDCAGRVRGECDRILKAHLESGSAYLTKTAAAPGGFDESVIESKISAAHEERRY